MNWKDQLKILEYQKKWDPAIIFMQKVITENPNDLDAYLSINYLLMNLLVEEDYDSNNHDYYADLLKKYFTKSYSKFYQDAEYLFFSAIIAFMSEWYFDISIEKAREMMKQATILDPESILYKWGYYAYLDMRNAENKKHAMTYAHLVLAQNSFIKKILESKGALGEYILAIMANWAKDSK